MSKARTLADFISDGSEFADGTISVAEVSGAAPLASPTFTGTTTVSGDLTVFNDDGNSSSYGFKSDHYAQIQLTSDADASSGGPYLTQLVGNGNNGTLELRTNGTQYLGINQAGNVTINESGLNADFRVESDSRTHALFVDASRGQVSIGNSSWDSDASSSVAQLLVDTGIHAEYFGTIALSYFTSNYDQYYKGLSGKHLSTEIARGLHIFNFDNDSAAGIQFWPKNKPGDTSPERGGYMGTSRNFVWEGLATFNENGGDYDFRVESTGTANMFQVDAGSNVVNINSSNTAHDTATKLQVAGRVRFGSGYGAETAGMTTPSTTMILTKESFNPTSGATRIYGLAAQNSGYAVSGSTAPMAVLLGGWNNGSSRAGGIEYDPSTYNLHIMAGATGAGQTGFQDTGRVASFNSSSIVFNDQGNNQDFRVESDNNSNMIRVDAGNDRVGIACSPASTFMIDVDGAVNSGGGDHWNLNKWFVISDGSSTSSSGLGITHTAAGGTYISSIHPFVAWRDLKFQGDQFQFLNGGTNNILQFDNSNFIVNENSLDVDFRIESDAEANMFVVNAGANKITVGNTHTNGPLNVFNRGGIFNTTGWGDAAITTYGSFGGGIALVDDQSLTSTAKGYILYTADNGNDFAIQQGSSRTSTTGGVYLNNAATSWSSLSDEREKENLVNITGAVDNIKTLRAVKGNYIDQPDVDKAFLIAQDVNAFLPEAVSVRNKYADEADQRLGLDYNQIIPVLVAAIKEQQTTIEDLETRLAALESA